MLNRESDHGWRRRWAAEHAAFVEAEAAKILREAQAAAEATAAEAWAEYTVSEPDLAAVVKRSDYVSREAEARYVTRDAAGLPTLRLVDAGDRLVIWSPLDGGALLNPKGPGLRSLGLVTTFARGSAHNAHTYRRADLQKGRWIELRREPENAYDPNAVAMHLAESTARFGYVSRGRAPAVARRMDAGEDIAGVTIWGPSGGDDDRSTLVLIGSRADLRAMLDP